MTITIMTLDFNGFLSFNFTDFFSSFGASFGGFSYFLHRGILRSKDSAVFFSSHKRVFCYKIRLFWLICLIPLSRCEDLMPTLSVFILVLFFCRFGMYKFYKTLILLIVRLNDNLFFIKYSIGLVRMHKIFNHFWMTLNDVIINYINYMSLCNFEDRYYVND